MEYVFAKKINGTDETGIITVSTMFRDPKLICLCTEEQSKELLPLLNAKKKLAQILAQAYLAVENKWTDEKFGLTIGNGTILSKESLLGDIESQLIILGELVPEPVKGESNG